MSEWREGYADEWKGEPDPPLAAAFRNATEAIERLGQALHGFADAVRSESEADTREFLAREVYGCPVDLLDDVIRVSGQQPREK